MTPFKTWLAGTSSQHTTTGSRLPVLIAAVLAVAAIAFSVLAVVKATGTAASASTPPEAAAECPDGYDTITPAADSSYALVCRQAQGSQWHVMCQSLAGDIRDEYHTRNTRLAEHPAECLREILVQIAPSNADEEIRASEEQRQSAALLLDADALPYIIFSEKWIEALMKSQAELAEAEAPAKTPLPASHATAWVVAGNEEFPHLTINYTSLKKVRYSCYDRTARSSSNYQTLKKTKSVYLEDLVIEILALCQSQKAWWLKN